jgi:mannose-6-phosphate isomerase-like protein (cupin superfamily)
MTNRTGKAWGQTTEIFRAPFFQAHLLEIKAGAYCSEHRHARKVNHFFVLSGKLEILTWQALGQPPDRTALGPGEGTDVPAGLWHQFRALEATTALELYEPAPIAEDIERRTTGGEG